MQKDGDVEIMNYSNSGSIKLEGTPTSKDRSGSILAYSVESLNESGNFSLKSSISRSSGNIELSTGQTTLGSNGSDI